MQVEVSGEQFELFSQKAVWWKKESSLLLADLHLGKVNHFRRSGIPVPTKASEKNIEILVELIQKTKPDRVICLGDLFHSHYNPEWEVFGELVRHFKSVCFELVIGNHDIMSKVQYDRKKIVVHRELQLGPFLLTHHPLEEQRGTSYNLAGHIHPGVSLKGGGRQSLTLPCFYFGEKLGLLPAFGMFTGIARIVPEKGDKIFVVADEKVISVS